MGNNMNRTRRSLVTALVLGMGCSPDVQVDIPVGPIRDTVNLPVASVPSALVDPTGRLITVACSATSPCPTIPVQDLTLQCVADRCALGAFALRTQSQLVDLATFSTFQEYAGVLDAVSLRRAQIGFTGLRVGNVVGPLELTWSAESDADGAAARGLATMPRTVLTATTQEVELGLNIAEVQSLARAVLGGTRKFRVRITGPVSLGDGALPAAQVELALRLLFHIDTSP